MEVHSEICYNGIVIFHCEHKKKERWIQDL